MFNYKLGLEVGGLMEQPEYCIQKILDVQADSLHEAIDKWANLTGEDKRGYWCPTRQTVWGWSVVCLYSDDVSCKIYQWKDRYCHTCGKEIKLSFIYCPSCGKLLHEDGVKVDNGLQ